MRTARPETKASADDWLRKAGVDHLPSEHPERRQALAAWGRWHLRQPNPDAFKMAAPNDPNRLGTPKGWNRAG